MMDYIQARLRLIRLGLAAFCTGERLRTLIEREGSDWGDFVATLARSDEPDALAETERDLGRLLGEDRHGQAYVVKSIGTSKVDYRPHTRHLAGLPVEAVPHPNGATCPDYGVYLVRTPNARGARRRVGDGQACSFLQVHLCAALDDPDPQDTFFQELAIMDNVCDTLIARANDHCVSQTAYDGLARYALERFNRLDHRAPGGCQTLPLLATQAHIDGTRLLIEAFKTQQPLRALIEAQGHALPEFMRLWVDSQNERECAQHLAEPGTLCAEGLSGEPYLLKFVASEDGLAGRNQRANLSTEPIDNIRVEVIATPHSGRASVSYCLTRARSLDQALENVLEGRSRFMFSVEPSNADGGATSAADRDRLYCEVIRDADKPCSGAERWRLERQIARTFGVQELDRAFALCDETVRFERTTRAASALRSLLGAMVI